MGFLKYFHLLITGVWIGGIVFFSFILTPTLFKQLSKEVTSKVLDLIFPNYYWMGMVCSVAALVTSFFNGFRIQVSTLLLLVMLGMTFYAGLSLYPKAHKLKVEIKAFPSEEAVPAEVRAEFKKAHRLAVLLNMLVLLCGLSYLWFLSNSIPSKP